MNTVSGAAHKTHCIQTGQLQPCSSWHPFLAPDIGPYKERSRWSEQWWPSCTPCRLGSWTQHHTVPALILGCKKQTLQQGIQTNRIHKKPTICPVGKADVLLGTQWTDLPHDTLMPDWKRRDVIALMWRAAVMAVSGRLCMHSVAVDRVTTCWAAPNEYVYGTFRHTDSMQQSEAASCTASQHVFGLYWTSSPASLKKTH